MIIGKASKYDIHIEMSVNKGFIVKVGCATFVAESKETLLSGLDKYLSNPDEVEKAYNRLIPDSSVENHQENVLSPRAFHVPRPDVLLSQPTEEVLK